MNIHVKALSAFILKWEGFLTVLDLSGVQTSHLKPCHEDDSGTLPWKSTNYKKAFMIHQGEKTLKLE